MWLTKHTKLSPEEINAICPNIHEFKIILLRNSQVNLEVSEIDPIKNGFCSSEELYDELADVESNKVYTRIIAKQKQYIPQCDKQYIPGGIVWMAKNYPQLKNKDIAKIFHKTSQFVAKVLMSKDTIRAVDPFVNQLISREAFDFYAAQKID